MPIICQLCNSVFEKIIPSTHLKYSHDISSQEYKNRYGKNSLASDDYRASRSKQMSGENNPMFGQSHTDSVKNRISQQNKGRTAYNKGRKITDPAQLEKYKQAARNREEVYKLAERHPKLGQKQSDETKDKISKSVAFYAESHQDEIKERAQKILTTKIQNQYDFGSPMRGKTHTLATKEKIRESLAGYIERFRQVTLVDHKDLARSVELEIVDSINNVHQLKCLKCDSHFELTAQHFTKSKIRNNLCPFCRPVPTKSSAELEIFDFIRSSVNGVVYSGNRSIITPLELDIYIPSLNIAIEYCGLYWHSELQGKDKNYHLSKHLLCQQKGVRLITIFEDEWINNSKLVKSRLLAIFGKSQNKIYARKCHVREISNKDARQFYQLNHIQGAGQCLKSYGLFHDDCIVAAMSFSKLSISKGYKGDNIGKWELNRYCTAMNFSIVGGASRLFKQFTSTENPEEIISYSDNRWNTGNVYQLLGFEFSKITPPTYWYFRSNEISRRHRFSLRKNENDDLLLTEWQNRQNQGYNRIWDCGNTKWIWNSQK